MGEIEALIIISSEAGGPCTGTRLSIISLKCQTDLHVATKGSFMIEKEAPVQQNRKHVKDLVKSD